MFIISIFSQKMMQLYCLLKEKHRDVEDQLINDARLLALFAVDNA